MVLEIVEVAMVAMMAAVAAVVAIGSSTCAIPVVSTTSSYMWDTLGGNATMIGLLYGGGRGVEEPRLGDGKDSSYINIATSSLLV